MKANRTKEMDDLYTYRRPSSTPQKRDALPKARQRQLFNTSAPPSSSSTSAAAAPVAGNRTPRTASGTRQTREKTTTAAAAPSSGRRASPSSPTATTKNALTTKRSPSVTRSKKTSLTPLKPSPPPSALSSSAHTSTTAAGGSDWAGACSLERSLMYMRIATSESLAPPVQFVLGQVEAALAKQARQQRAAQPRTQRPASRSGAGAGAANPSPPGTGDARAEIVQCLVRASAAAGPAAALEVLGPFYESGCGKELPEHCLVSAALAEALLLAPGEVSTERPAVSGTDSTAAHALALEALEAAVEQGHMAAMLRLGLCLRDGSAGLSVNLPAALTWVEQAAEFGYAPAMNELGEMYEQGVARGDCVLDEDWGAALHWYQAAAERGLPAAQLNCGKLMLLAADEANNSGAVDAAKVASMKKTARDWLEAAANSKVREATELLKRIR